METFITDVSTTRTNIAIASRTASLRSPFASSGALVPASPVIARSPSRRSHARRSCSAQTARLLGCRLASVQGFLELLLVLLGQGGLQHGAAELAHGLDGLVRGDLLQHQEQRRGARLQHVADLVLELLVDAGLGQLAEQRA